MSKEVYAYVKMTVTNAAILHMQKAYPADHPALEALYAAHREAHRETQTAEGPSIEELLEAGNAAWLKASDRGELTPCGEIHQSLAQAASAEGFKAVHEDTERGLLIARNARGQHMAVKNVCLPACVAFGPEK